MNTVQNSFPSIEQIRDRYLKSDTKQRENNASASFEDIFSTKIDDSEPVRFSKHASLRLSDRGIDLSNEQTMRLSDGIEKAKSKGIQESLVLMDELAFIVNVDKSTVITAMDSGESDIFTNIDGAVIV